MALSKTIKNDYHIFGHDKKMYLLSKNLECFFVGYFSVQNIGYKSVHNFAIQKSSVHSLKPI